jgi:type 1 glutamine amidotransferase
MTKPKIRFIGFFLFLVLPAAAQHTWQKPMPPRTRSSIDNILGPAHPADGAVSRDLNVVLVWGYDNDTHSETKKTHPAGCHEYRKSKDLWAGLLGKVPRVHVDSAMYFPTPQQWQKADLVVFYLHLDFLVDSHYVYIDKYLARGGGLVAIHETMIQRPTGQAWADRIGLAWNEPISKWGQLPTPVKIVSPSANPIFQGFPDTLGIVDEFYWDLMSGNAADLQVLATSPAGPAGVSSGPAPPDQLDGKSWPLFWTYKKGPGKVFATLAGHNLYSFNDPFLRIAVLRGMAWAMGEKFEPFRGLVTDGVAVTEDKPATLIADPRAGKAPVRKAPRTGRTFRLDGRVRAAKAAFKGSGALPPRSR